MSLKNTKLCHTSQRFGLERCRRAITG